MPSLIVCAALLGLANSVYHPADYAILSAHMDEARMGRAFSIHTFAGFLGGAVAPAIMAALVATDRRPRRADGGRRGRPAGGAVAGRHRPSRCRRAASARPNGEQAPQQNVITPAIIVLTIFFMLLGLSNAGIGNFGVVALMSGYGVSFASANIALTAFLGASAVGVLAGGFLADRTERHGQVAAACFAINAAIVLVIALVGLPSLVLTAAMAHCRLPRRRDRAVARHAGAQRGASGRGGPRLRHRLHRLQLLGGILARCCSAGSWTRTCRTGCSAPPSCSWC